MNGFEHFCESLIYQTNGQVSWTIRSASSCVGLELIGGSKIYRFNDAEGGVRIWIGLRDRSAIKGCTHDSPLYYLFPDQTARRVGRANAFRFESTRDALLAYGHMVLDRFGYGKYARRELNLIIEAMR